MFDQFSSDPQENLLSSVSLAGLNSGIEPENTVIVPTSGLSTEQNLNQPVTVNPADSLLLSGIGGSDTTGAVTLVDNQSSDALTGEAMNIAKGKLIELAQSPDFIAKMNVPFGENWNTEVANSLKQNWLEGDFSSIPPIEIVAKGEIAGANGAFAQATNTIYLSQKFLRENGTNSQAVADVLLEEIGHYIDSKINITDSPGDEGEIFAGIVQGKELSEVEIQRLQSENDHDSVVIDGNKYLVEKQLNDGNNTLNTAQGFSTWSGVNTTVERTNRVGSVGGTDLNDYYKFSLNNTRQVNITLNGLQANANIQLLNKNGTKISTSAKSGTLAESITQILNAGDYFIRVYPSSNASTNYQVNLTLKEPGNSPGDALNIGVLNKTRTFNQFVGNSDSKDYYRFRVASPMNFSLNLDGLGANADVYLYQDSNNDGLIDNNESIDYSWKYGTDSESIARTLGIGNYFVLVQPGSEGNNTNYTLRLVNQTSETTNIGVLTGTRTFNQFVGNTDSKDYYRFHVASPMNFSLNLDGLGANADVYLYQDSNDDGLIDNNESIDYSWKYGTDSESIARTLGIGNYFVLVQPGSEGNNTNYTLRLVNQTSETTNIGVLTGTRTFNQFVGKNDPVDYYRFSLNSPRTFTLSLDSLSANADVYLYQDSNDDGLIDNNESIDYSWKYGTDSESIARNLGMGNYFVKVMSASEGSNTNYNMTLSA